MMPWQDGWHADCRVAVLAGQATARLGRRGAWLHAQGREPSRICAGRELQDGWHGASRMARLIRPSSIGQLCDHALPYRPTNVPVYWLVLRRWFRNASAALRVHVANARPRQAAVRCDMWQCAAKAGARVVAILSFGSNQVGQVGNGGMHSGIPIGQRIVGLDSVLDNLGGRLFQMRFL